MGESLLRRWPWRTALRAEMAVSARADSAPVLWDLLKCFEHGRHFLLAQEAAEVEFPIVIARMSAEMYRAERRLIIDEAVSEAIHPTRGFMAGCARALALVKVLMIRRMDAYVARHPRVNLDIYVDDVELQAVGTERIVETMAAAVTDLKRVLVDELGFPLADEKACVIGPIDGIAAGIVAATGGVAGRQTDRAVKLGIELRSGMRIGRRGGHKRVRLRKAMARQRRIFKFKKMGGAAVKVVRRGVIPSTAYGSSVTGVSNAELRQIRSLVAQTITPNTRGASVALKLLLDGDPAVEANAAPIVKWAETAWEAAAPISVNAHSAAGVPGTQRWCDDHAAGACSAQRLVVPPRIGSRGAAEIDRRITGAQLNGAIAHAVVDTRDGSWETVRGPASATVLTARRIGWAFSDGTTVIDDRGRALDMAVTAPACIKNAVTRATRKATAVEAAARWGRPEFADGIWAAPVRTALGRLKPAAKAALRRTWTGGYWDKARLADAGLAREACCDKCGAKRDDSYHRIWECQWEDIKIKREALAVSAPQMLGEAARVARDDMAYTRGLKPTPWSKCAPPREDFGEIHVDGEMNELSTPLVIGRPVFVDGSALWPHNAEARRAGWSVVMIDDDGKLIGAVYGHLPCGEDQEQTAGGAEMYALRRAAELTVTPLVAYTDYKEAAEGATKGQCATTGPKVKHATHWRAFWRAVDGTDFRVTKVKGHITEAEVAHDELLTWRREGNRHADRLAKKGARAHYTEEQWAAAKENIKGQEYHADLCTWIGNALGTWPTENRVRRKAVDRDAMTARRQKRRDEARQVGGHRILWGRDGWKCQDCGVQARSQSGAKKLMNQPCKGHLTTRIPMQDPSGASAHILWTAEADEGQGRGGANVTWCGICGAYSSTKLYKLRGRCGGPAGKAALTRLRALQALRHPVLNYKLKRPHRMTDALMRIMVSQAAERRKRYEDMFKACGSQDSPAACQGQNEGDTPNVEMHMSPEFSPADEGRCDYTEQDVFGHGGDLTNDYDMSQRLELQGHGAPQEHVAGAHTGGDGMKRDPERDESIITYHAVPRPVPGWHGADGDGGELRAVPSWHAAAQRRGTKVWVWKFQYGAWRWVAASEDCTGDPCICDLMVTPREMTELIMKHGVTSAERARALEAEIVRERHDRRSAERGAMAAEDKASCFAEKGATAAAQEGFKRRRLVGGSCSSVSGADEMRYDSGEGFESRGGEGGPLAAARGRRRPEDYAARDPADGGVIGPLAGLKRSLGVSAASSEAKRGRCYVGDSAWAHDSNEASIESDGGDGRGSDLGERGKCFASRSHLLSALRGGGEAVNLRYSGEAKAGEEKPGRQPTSSASVAHEGRRAVYAECSAEQDDGPRVKRRQVAEPGSASEAVPVPIERLDDGTFNTRHELLEVLRGRALRKGPGGGAVG